MKSGEVSRERREVYIILRISAGSSKNGEGSEVVDMARSDEVPSLFSIEVSPMATAGFPVRVEVVVAVKADMLGVAIRVAFVKRGFSNSVIQQGTTIRKEHKMAAAAEEVMIYGMSKRGRSSS